MALTLVTYPDPILEEVMPDFDFENPIVDPTELEIDMLACMFARGGIGLAAPQVGIRARVFTIGHATMPQNSFAVFNPVIVDCSTELRLLEEGCLSFPGIYARVKRPSWIVVEYFDKNGEKKTDRLEGYNCVCFLHEMDHLNGIVFKDRLSQLKWALAVKKSKKVKQYA